MVSSLYLVVYFLLFQVNVGLPAFLFLANALPKDSLVVGPAAGRFFGLTGVFFLVSSLRVGVLLGSLAGAVFLTGAVVLGFALVFLGGVADTVSTSGPPSRVDARSPAAAGDF